MRKVFFMLFVSLVIVSLASVSLAGEYRIVREKWDQNLHDLSTGKLTPTYKGEWIQSVNGIPPRAGERGRGEDGKEYVWVEAGAERRSAQPTQQISRPQVHPVPNVERRPANYVGQQRLAQPPIFSKADAVGRRPAALPVKVHSQSTRRLAPLHPAIVSYRLKKGETITTGTRDYTVEPSARKIMKATGITPGQDKRLPVGFPVAIPEKVLKPEYRDPLPKLKALYAEREQLVAEIEALRISGGLKDELIKAQRAKIAELDGEIIRLKAEAVQKDQEMVKKDQEIANLKSSPPSVVPATPAAPAVPTNPPVQQPVAPPTINPVPATPASPAVAPPATQTAPAVQQPAQPGVIPVRNPDGLSSNPGSIPTIGGTENIAKKSASDNWDDVLEKDFGIKAEGKAGSKLARK